MGNIASTTDEPKMEYLNWKIPFAIGLFITVFMAYFLIYVKEYLIGRLNNDIFKRMYNIFVVLLLLNLIMATYTVTLYYYRINKNGMKGVKGTYGKIGSSGKDNQCDLFTPKTKTFNLSQDIKIEPYNVDTSKTDAISKYTVDVDDTYEPKWKRMYVDDDNPVKDNYLGSKYTSCLRDNKCDEVDNINAEEDADKAKNFRPFTGALCNYEVNNNNTMGNVNSLQFTYNKDDSSNYEKIELVGTKLGYTDNEDIGDNFKCPANSAIYKIETLHDEDRVSSEGTDYGTIKGIKFHCRDIATGNPVKILDSNNNEVDNVSFGIEPKSNNNQFVYDSVECGNKQVRGEVLPGFVSNYTALHSDKHGINTLAINQCSYYDNKNK